MEQIFGDPDDPRRAFTAQRPGVEPDITAERVLASATERDVLAAALRLVAELGQAEQAPLVRPFLGHDDPVIRLAAIQALATTGGEADESLLRQGMEDESAWVAIHAARALVHTGDSGSLRQLARSEEPRALLARQVLLESA